MIFERPPAEPLGLFRQWLDDARQLDLPNPNAMTLATAMPQGRPSARIVLLKGLDERGVVFFTNYDSRKGRELAANPYAAVLLHWDTLNRQIRVEGTVSRVSDAESDAYFATRPRGSQIGAWASRQSQPLSSRAALVAEAAIIGTKYLGRAVPRPPHWGGFRIALERLEFWQGRDSRLHDRLIYTPTDDGTWSIQRLFP